MATIEKALAKHQSGEYEAAKGMYCEVIASDPTNADAWHLLGMLLFSTGHSEDSLECLRKATAFVPNDPSMLSNLGLVYRSLGRHDDAVKTLELSVQLAPHSVAARNNIATLLMDAGLLEAAETHLQSALKIDSGDVDSSMNLGNIRQQQGRQRDAELIYRKCLRRDPDNSLALTNLGESLRQQCNWQEAIDVFQQALQLNPQLTETRLNLGRTLLNLARHDEALAQFRDLIDRLPNNAKAHHYLGKAMHEIGDASNAIECLTHALELDPTDAYTRSTLGFVHLESGNLQLASESFRQAIEVNPKLSEAHGCLLYLMSGDPNVGSQQMYDEHVRWGQMHGNVETLGTRPNGKQTNRRLRIGYVSPDLRDHAVATFIRPVLQCHDRSSVEVFCYAEVPVPDQITDEMRRLSDHWRFTTGQSDRQVAQQIAADEIDILVDLAGHTSRNRLLAFARKPAPVQMTWLGYPNTTGLSAIDYRLTCEVQNPADEESYHTERLIRMKGGSFCYSPPADAPAVSPPPAVENGFITFGSLQRPFKISAQVCKLWARVLLACPNSRLLAFNTRFTSESEAAVRRSLTDQGIDPQRITIAREHDGDSYLEMYCEIDIALDVFPWAGGTTTLEALWMGVPAVACYGDRRSSRSTAAIVGGIGHPKWVAYSDDQYVQCCKNLAADIAKLCEHRASLREKVRTTIADHQRFTRELEKVYRQAWADWCKQ